MENYGAVERTRTSTVLLPPAPQAGASASSATTAPWVVNHSNDQKETLQPPPRVFRVPFSASGGRGDYDKFPTATAFSLARGQTAEPRELAAPASMWPVPKTKLADSALDWALLAQAVNWPGLASQAAELPVADRSAAGCACPVAAHPGSSREPVLARAAKPSGGSNHPARPPCPYAPPWRRSKP